MECHGGVYRCLLDKLCFVKLCNIGRCQVRLHSMRNGVGLAEVKVQLVSFVNAIGENLGKMGRRHCRRWPFTRSCGEH